MYTTDFYNWLLTLLSKIFAYIYLFWSIMPGVITSHVHEEFNIIFEDIIELILKKLLNLSAYVTYLMVN